MHNRGLETFYEAQGYTPLRQIIAERLRGRGMGDVRASNVLVTTGSQQALDVIARTLVDRRVAVESPVYWGARLLFESHGLETTGLPLDPFAGVPLDAWEKRLASARPSLVYAITSYQNPTGYSYTSHELEALLGMYEAGEIHPHVDRTFTFDEAPAAHHFIHDRKAVGKVLLVL